MSAPFATVEDVAALWRALSPEETRVADARLLVVSELIRAKVPSVDVRLASGALNPVIVRVVAVDAVRRAMEAPSDGVRSRTQTVGPFSESVTYTDAAHSGVWLSEAELSLLRGGSSTSAARVGVRSFRVRSC